MRTSIRIFLIATIFISVISSCNLLPSQQSGELSFETLSKKSFINYRGEAAKLEVVSSQEDVQILPDEIGENTQIQRTLEDLDYNQEFAVIVFNGYRLLFNYDITVKKIVRKDNDVEIYAEFIKPDPKGLVQPGSSSPYHMISVSKSGSWGEDITFKLFDQNNDETEVVTKITHFVP
jgi:hypothetical protein